MQTFYYVLGLLLTILWSFIAGASWEFDSDHFQWVTLLLFAVACSFLMIGGIK